MLARPPRIQIVPISLCLFDILGIAGVERLGRLIRVRRELKGVWRALRLAQLLDIQRLLGCGEGDAGEWILRDWVDLGRRARVDRCADGARAGVG